MKKNNDNNNNNDFWSSFKYSYDHIEGFDSFVKIILFIVLTIVFILVAKISLNNQSNTSSTTTTTSIIQKQNKILNIIEGIIKQEATLKMTSGDTKVQISSIKEENGEITGFYQDINTSKKFKINDGKVYELVLDEEIENEELFSSVNLDFIIPSMLYGVIEESTYKDETTGMNLTYTYEYIKDEIKYDITVTIASKKVQSINIKNDTTSYEITYK